ncbi:MAG: hypothetical protein WC710_13820 [Gallionella sp.]|jgi:hypothetical protein
MSRKTESGKWGVVARHFGFRRNPVKKIRSKQQGFALLLFVTVLATAATTLTVKALNNNGNVQIDRNKITAAALAQAKDALTGYAITYGDTHSGEVHGYLPCPDTSGTDIGGEGAAAGVCDTQNVSAIGRLPWKTLDIPSLRGGDNECLWYAVSGTYKNNPKSGLMNWDTNGQLQVYSSDGTTLLTPADNQAVAVIFSPGSAAAGQNRSGTTAPVCSGNYTASNYLDAVGSFNNASVSNTAYANSPFRMGDPTTQTGDRMVFITKQDIWNAMQRRKDFLAKLNTLTQKTAECIASFGTKNKINGVQDTANKSLPWPALLSPSNSNDYSINTNYNDIADTFSGRVPYRVNTSRSSGTTGNSIPSPYYLLQADGANCPAGWASIYPWWDNWKDHLFYAISERYKPDNVATTDCTSDHCVSVNDSVHYAAVVIFAGKKLSGQTRASSVTDSQRGIASRYLEGSNATNIANSNTNGNEDYQMSTTSNTFNDIVYCIKQDLSVVPGNPLLTPICP